MPDPALGSIARSRFLPLASTTVAGRSATAKWLSDWVYCKRRTRRPFVGPREGPGLLWGGWGLSWAAEIPSRASRDRSRQSVTPPGRAAPAPGTRKAAQSCLPVQAKNPAGRPGCKYPKKRHGSTSKRPRSPNRWEDAEADSQTTHRPHQKTRQQGRGQGSTRFATAQREVGAPHLPPFSPADPHPSGEGPRPRPKRSSRVRSPFSPFPQHPTPLPVFFSFCAVAKDRERAPKKVVDEKWGKWGVWGLRPRPAQHKALPTTLGRGWGEWGGRSSPCD